MGHFSVVVSVKVDFKRRNNPHSFAAIFFIVIGNVGTYEQDTDIVFLIYLNDYDHL